MSDMPEANTFNLFDRFRAELETAHRVVIERKNAVGGLDAYYILHAPSLLADLPATDAQVMANPKVQALVDLIKRAEHNTPEYHTLWHSDARAALAALEADT